MLSKSGHVTLSGGKKWCHLMRGTLVVLMGILKNPCDRIREFIFKKLCQKDFAIGPLFKVDLGNFFFAFLHIFVFY